MVMINRLLLLITFFSCNKSKDMNGYVKYKVKKGEHASSPLYFYTYVKSCNIKSSAFFTEKSVYDLKNSDQLDWNKLDGFKMDLNRVPTHAAMVAWRYNIVDSVFEVAPYFNNNGLILPEFNEIIKLKEGETFGYNISLYGDNANVTITKGVVTIGKTLKLRSGFILTRVSLWFGGNKKAPNDIEVYIKK